MPILQQNILTFIFYVTFSWLGLLLGDRLTGDISSFYPAAGVALATAIIWGRRVVISLTLAALCTTSYYHLIVLTENIDPLMVLVTTIAIVAQAYLGKAILNLCLPASWEAFSRIKDILAFFLWVVIFCSLISPIIVMVFQFYINEIEMVNLLVPFWFWWLGDAAGIIVITPLLLKIYLTKKSTKKNVGRFILPIVIFAITSSQLVYFSQKIAQNYIIDEIKDRQAGIALQIESVFNNYVNNIEIYRNYFSSTQKMNHKVFTEITSPFIENKPWATVSFNEMVFEENRKEFETELTQMTGVNTSVFSSLAADKSRVLAKKSWYMAVKYIIPKDINSQAIGYDINSNPERSLAVMEAMQSNKTVISDPITLVQTGHKGLLVITPIYINDESDSIVSGLIVGVIDIKEMLEQVIASNWENGWHFKLSHILPNKQEVLFTQSNYPKSLKNVQMFDQILDFKGVKIKLDVAINDAYFISKIPISSYFIPLVNLIFLVLFSSLIFTLWSRQNEVDLKVKKQTRVLQDIHDVQSVFIVEHKTDQIFEPILTHMLEESASQIGFLARLSDKKEKYFEVVSCCDVSQQPINRDVLLRHIGNILEYLKEQKLPFISNKPLKISFENNSQNEGRMIESCLFLPVIQDDNVVAIIGMMNADEPYSLSIPEGFNLWVSTFNSILHGLNERHKKQIIQFELEKNYQVKKQSQERVAQQAKALAELTHNKAFTSGEWDQAFDALTLSVGNTLGVARLGVWLFNEESTKLVCNSMYVKHENHFLRGIELRKEHYPLYFKKLGLDSRIVADDAKNHPATKEFSDSYLLPLGITSMLDAGIVKDGKLIGAVCAEHVGEVRHWLPEEENYISIISGLASQLVYSKEKNTIQSQLLTQQIEKSYIVDNMKEGIITLDGQGEILSFNRAAEVMFGYTESELKGKSVSILIPKNHSFKQEKYLTDFLQTNGGKAINTKTELVAIKKDASEFPIMLNVTELPSSGNTKKFLGSFLDITVDKLQQYQLLHNQKMEALGQLTGGVAHDFNNILGIMMGYSELVSQEVSGKLLTYSEQVLEAGERARLLTKELLSFASKKEEHSEIVDLNNLLSNKRLMLEKALSNQIQLIFSSNNDYCQIKVDVYELEHALLNLAINAKHAMNNKGVLGITTSVKTINKTTNNLIPVKNGNYVCLSIQDNGCGIDDVTLKKLFEPFFTTKGEDGTGLGLAQVYGFIQRSNGTISVDSKLNEGTTFNLYFPVLNTKSESVSKKAKKKELVRGSGTILVVDDEKLLTDLFSIELANLGYKVFVANNAKSALEKMADNEIDLLLSDILMPKVTGIDLAKTILINYPNCKIQLMSGFSDSIDTSSIPNELYLNRLIKPFSMFDLSKRISALLTN